MRYPKEAILRSKRGLPSVSRLAPTPIKYEEIGGVEKKTVPIIEGHPLASSAGSLRDDPFWDDMMASIQEFRRELETEYNTPE